jgi:hypothetical protein
MIQGNRVTSPELSPVAAPATGVTLPGTVSPSPALLGAVGRVYVLATPQNAPGQLQRIASVASDGSFQLEDLAPSTPYALRAYEDLGQGGVIEVADPRSPFKRRLTQSGANPPIALELAAGPVRIAQSTASDAAGERVNVLMAANARQPRSVRAVSASRSTPPVDLPATGTPGAVNFTFTSSFAREFQAVRLDGLWPDHTLMNLPLTWSSRWATPVAISASTIARTDASASAAVPSGSGLQFLIFTLRHAAGACTRVVPAVSQTVACHGMSLASGSYYWEVQAVDEDGNTATTNGPATNL